MRQEKENLLTLGFIDVELCVTKMENVQKQSMVINKQDGKITKHLGYLCAQGLLLLRDQID